MKKTFPRVNSFDWFFPTSLVLFSFVGAILGVARWHIFKPKIQIWVNFERPFNGRCWYILWPFGLFQSQLVYFVAIWFLWGFFVYFSRFGALHREKSGNPGPV
jgi:hypothetical protein